MIPNAKYDKYKNPVRAFQRLCALDLFEANGGRQKYDDLIHRFPDPHEFDLRAVLAAIAIKAVSGVLYMHMCRCLCAAADLPCSRLCFNRSIYSH